MPEAQFDLSVVVSDTVTWGQISGAARVAAPFVHRVAFLDEFRGAWVPSAHRSISLRVTLRPTGATLTTELLDRSRADVLRVLRDEVGARLRE